MRSSQIPLLSHCSTWLQASINQQRRKPPGSCFKGSKEGHCSCLNQGPPPAPGPSCGIEGHWKVYCSNPPPGIQTSPPGPEQESPDPALPSLLGLAAEDWRCPGPQAPTLITSMEPRVTLPLAGKPISFLTVTGVTYSALPAYSRKTRVSQLSAMGVDGLISTLWITKPLPCTLQDTPFSHSFLILPKHPTLILWETFSQNSKPLLLSQACFLI